MERGEDPIDRRAAELLREARRRSALTQDQDVELRLHPVPGRLRSLTTSMGRTIRRHRFTIMQLAAHHQFSAVSLTGAVARDEEPGDVAGRRPVPVFRVTGGRLGGFPAELVRCDLEELLGVQVLVIRQYWPEVGALLPSRGGPAAEPDEDAIPLVEPEE